MTERVPLLFLIVALLLRLTARLAPLLISVLLVVIANLPISFTAGLLPAPELALVAIFFWALTRPNLMPPAAVLAIGLAEDLLSGGPPGLWAAGFIAAYLLIDRERKTFLELSGAGIFIAFTGVVLLTAATAYALASGIYVRLLPIAPLLLQCIVTVILFPVLERPLAWVDRSIGRSLRATI